MQVGQESIPQRLTNKSLLLLQIQTSILIRKTLKIEHHKQNKHFTPFQKNITNITIWTKNADKVSRIKEKINLLINFHVSKKEKTVDTKILQYIALHIKNNIT